MTHGAYMYLMGLLVGVLARSLFVAGIKDVARALARRPAPPLPPVNVFHGTVFPDPADPRWVDGPRDAAGAPTLRFGDSDITLGCLWLTVDGVEVERGLGTAGLYYDAVQAARSGAARARALASVDRSVVAAGQGEPAALSATAAAAALTPVCPASAPPAWAAPPAAPALDGPVVIDGHTLPSPADSRWELSSMGTLAVFRSDGVATSLYVFDTGRVDVGFQTWFTHRDARPYYAKVHGRLAAAAARKRATELAESVAAIERAARGTR